MTKKKQSFLCWYPWPKMTKKNKNLLPLVSLAKNAQNPSPLLSLAKNNQDYFLKTSEIRMGSVFVRHTNNVSIPGSSNEHCTNVFTCFNLLLVCARNLAKKISRKGGSTKIIDIFPRKKNFRDHRSRYIDITAWFLR